MGGKLLRFLKSHNVAFSASGKGLTEKKNEGEQEVWQHPSPTPQRPQTSGVQWVLVYALPQNFACT